MSSRSKGNWGLKLLALILAIVIYYALKNDSAANGRGKDIHAQERSIFQSR